MIGRLSGTVLEKNPPQILLDVGGVGYEVDVPMSTFYHLPALGEPVVLHTHLAMREDGHFLYGFFSVEERAAFRQLIKVSGIGARTALAVLSGLSVNDLAQAVALQETARIVKVPGIGKKTAERLVLELKDKLGKALPHTGAALTATAPGAPADDRSDILNALMALGYNEKEALRATKDLPPDTGVSVGIREALKVLAKV